jgi:transcriptional regulator with XRE-family HTH domain
MAKPDIVGRRIRTLRKARGLTQAQLAKATGLPQSQISQIESGARPGSTIQLDAARRLAFALGVSLDAVAGVPTDVESETVPATEALVGA